MTSLVTEKWLVLRSYLLIIPPTGTATTPQDFSVRDNHLILGNIRKDSKILASLGQKIPAFEPVPILSRIPSPHHLSLLMLIRND